MDAENLYFALEPASNGDLDGFIKLSEGKPADKGTAQFILGELVLALEAMSDACIAHRDLKPANILINSDFRLKVCDFGESKKIAKINYEKIKRDYAQFKIKSDLIKEALE